MVLYREDGMHPLDAPLGFGCWAEDMDHAEEQCLDAYPDCDIVWVVQTDEYETVKALDQALQDYWNG